MLFRGVASILLCLISRVALSATATLIAPGDYVDEGVGDIAEEARIVGERRGGSNVRNTRFVSVNAAALRHDVISIATPDGVKRDYFGSVCRTAGSDLNVNGRLIHSLGSLVWNGRAANQAGLLEGASARFDVNPAGLIMGRIQTEDGRVFWFSSHKSTFISHEENSHKRNPTPKMGPPVDGLPVITTGPAIPASAPLRQMPQTKYVNFVKLHPVKVNIAAIETSGVLTAVVDGIEYRFLGSPMPPPPKDPQTGADRGRNSVIWSGTAQKPFEMLGLLVLTRDLGSNSFYGSLSLPPARSFEITSAGGGVMFERDMNLQCQKVTQEQRQRYFNVTLPRDAVR